MTIAERVILFDLGGVLADLGDPVSAMNLDMTPDAFWSVWLNSSAVRAFETGTIATAEFCTVITGELGESDAAGFEHRLRAWRLPLYPGAEALLAAISGRSRIALLSNTNELHWQQLVSSTDAFSAFDHRFLSYETGYYKPARESFQQVMAHFDCAPQDILFLDDSVSNVAAARDMNIDAHRVNGVEAATEVLTGRQCT